MGNTTVQCRAAIGCFGCHRHRRQQSACGPNVKTTSYPYRFPEKELRLPDDLRKAINRLSTDDSEKKAYFNSTVSRALLLAAGIESNPGPGPGSSKRFDSGASKRQRKRAENLAACASDPKQQKLSLSCFSRPGSSSSHSRSSTPDQLNLQDTTNDSVFLSPTSPPSSLLLSSPSPCRPPSSVSDVDADADVAEVAQVCSPAGASGNKSDSEALEADDSDAADDVVPLALSPSCTPRMSPSPNPSAGVDVTSSSLQSNVDDGHSSEFAAVTGVSEVIPSDSDPFELFELKGQLSSAQKNLMKNCHPVQPVHGTVNGVKTKLPFKEDRVYTSELHGDKRLWISFCLKRNKLFRWVCRCFQVRPGTTAFSSSGWSSKEANWSTNGHVYQAVHRHEISADHVNAVAAFFSFSSRKASVNHFLNENLESLRRKQVAERREVVLRITNIILFLAKQGVAFRGDKQEAAYTLSRPCNHGNFLEECKSRAEYDPILKAHLARVEAESQKKHDENAKKTAAAGRGRGAFVTFLSKNSFRKILDIICSMILETIVSRIRQNGGKSSISLDGCQDVSVKEMLALVGRYVDEFGPVLLDISPPEADTSGESLLKHILKVLKNLGLPVSDLAGYSFDGAGNMAGAYSGVQARLKEIVPNSVFQHCYAHVLNLILQKSCDSVLEAEDLFILLRDSATAVSESYKRSGLWKELTALLYPDNTRMLVKLGKTRWWAKAKDCSRLFQEDMTLLPIIVTLLEIISHDSSLKAHIRSKIKGQLKQFCSFETVAVGVLFQKIFSLSGPVSDYLQSPQLDHVQAARLTSSLIPSISAIEIDTVLDEAQLLAEKCNDKIEELCLASKSKYEIQARFETECPVRRISKVTQNFGEKSVKLWDEFRHLASQKPANWPLKVKALIPIKDNCLGRLRDRFGDEAEGTLQIFKSCSFLNPENFRAVNDKGLPDGSLDHFCSLAKVDPLDVKAQLIVFAGSYEQLSKDIQADFRPYKNLEEFDVDFQHVSHSDTDDDPDDPGYPVTESTESTPGFGCPETGQCRGCLRCPYRILRKHSLYSVAFSSLAAVYKLALTLPCTQVTCERCFSKLKIIKTRLRSKMSDEFLRETMIISVERVITDSLKHEDILDRYARSSSELAKLLL